MISQSSSLVCSVYWKESLTAEVYKIADDTYYVKKYTDKPMIQPFPKEYLTHYEFIDALKGRCWEPDRANIGHILELLGLNQYDPLAIVKKTHGISYDDLMWFKFPDDTDVSFENVRRVRSSSWAI